MIQMCKNDLSLKDNYFYSVNSMYYFESKFISELIKTYEASKESMSPSEYEEYIIGVQKLKQFSELKDTLSKLQEFNEEMKAIYLQCQREGSMSNLFTHRDYITEVQEQDLKKSIQQYVDLLNALQDYPEWQEKIRNDIGNYVHLMYNNLSSDPKISAIFQGFDSQFFFK